MSSTPMDVVVSTGLNPGSKAEIYWNSHKHYSDEQLANLAPAILGQCWYCLVESSSSTGQIQIQHRSFQGTGFTPGSTKSFNAFVNAKQWPNKMMSNEIARRKGIALETTSDQQENDSDEGEQEPAKKKTKLPSCCNLKGCISKAYNESLKNERSKYFASHSSSSSSSSSAQAPTQAPAQAPTQAPAQTHVQAQAPDCIICRYIIHDISTQNKVSKDMLELVPTIISTFPHTDVSDQEDMSHLGNIKQYYRSDHSNECWWCNSCRSKFEKPALIRENFPAVSAIMTSHDSLMKTVSSKTIQSFTAQIKPFTLKQVTSAMSAAGESYKRYSVVDKLDKLVNNGLLGSVSVVEESNQSNSGLTVANAVYYPKGMPLENVVGSLLVGELEVSREKHALQETIKELTRVNKQLTMENGQLQAAKKFKAGKDVQTTAAFLADQATAFLRNISDFRTGRKAECKEQGVSLSTIPECTMLGSKPGEKDIRDRDHSSESVFVKLIPKKTKELFLLLRQRGVDAVAGTKKKKKRKDPQPSDNAESKEPEKLDMSFFSRALIVMVVLSYLMFDASGVRKLCGGQIPWLVDISTFLYRQGLTAAGTDWLNELGICATNECRKVDEGKMRKRHKIEMPSLLQHLRMISTDNVGKAVHGVFTYFVLCIAWVLRVYNPESMLPTQAIFNAPGSSSRAADYAATPLLPRPIVPIASAADVEAERIPADVDLKPLGEIKREDFQKVGSTMGAVEVEAWKKWKSIVVAAHLLFVTKKWKEKGIIGTKEFQRQRSKPVPAPAPPAPPAPASGAPTGGGQSSSSSRTSSAAAESKDDVDNEADDGEDDDDDDDDSEEAREWKELMKEESKAEATVEYLARIIARIYGIGNADLPVTDPVILKGLVAKSSSYDEYASTILTALKKVLATEEQRQVATPQDPTASAQDPAAPPSSAGATAAGVATAPLVTTPAASTVPLGTAPSASGSSAAPGSAAASRSAAELPDDEMTPEDPPTGPRVFLKYADQEVYAHTKNAMRLLPQFHGCYQCFAGGLHTVFALAHCGLVKYGAALTDALKKIVKADDDADIKLNAHRDDHHFMTVAAEACYIELFKIICDEGELADTIGINTYPELLKKVDNAKTLDEVMAISDAIVSSLWNYVPLQTFTDDSTAPLPLSLRSERQKNPNVQLLANFCCVYYNSYLGYLTSGRICSLPLLVACEKVVLSHVFMTGQPNYQVLLSEMILLKLRWPKDKFHLIERSMCVRIKNDYRIMFTDEAQEEVNGVFKLCSKTAEGTHMENRAESLGIIMQIANNMLVNWIGETRHKKLFGGIFGDSQTIRRINKHGKGVDLLSRTFTEGGLNAFLSCPSYTTMQGLVPISGDVMNDMLYYKDKVTLGMNKVFDALLSTDPNGKQPSGYRTKFKTHSDVNERSKQAAKDAATRQGSSTSVGWLGAIFSGDPTTIAAVVEDNQSHPLSIMHSSSSAKSVYQLITRKRDEITGLLRKVAPAAFTSSPLIHKDCDVVLIDLYDAYKQFPPKTSKAREKSMDVYSAIFWKKVSALVIGSSKRDVELHIILPNITRTSPIKALLVAGARAGTLTTDAQTPQGPPLSGTSALPVQGWLNEHMPTLQKFLTAMVDGLMHNPAWLKEDGDSTTNCKMISVSNFHTTARTKIVGGVDVRDQYRDVMFDSKLCPTTSQQIFVVRSHQQSGHAGEAKHVIVQKVLSGDCKDKKNCLIFSSSPDISSLFLRFGTQASFGAFRGRRVIRMMQTKPGKGLVPGHFLDETELWRIIDKPVLLANVIAVGGFCDYVTPFGHITLLNLWNSVTKGMNDIATSEKNSLESFDFKDYAFLIVMYFWDRIPVRVRSQAFHHSYRLEAIYNLVRTDFAPTVNKLFVLSAMQFNDCPAKWLLLASALEAHARRCLYQREYDIHATTLDSRLTPSSLRAFDLLIAPAITSATGYVMLQQNSSGGVASEEPGLLTSMESVFRLSGRVDKYTSATIRREEEEEDDDDDDDDDEAIGGGESSSSNAAPVVSLSIAEQIRAITKSMMDDSRELATLRDASIAKNDAIIEEDRTTAEDTTGATGRAVASAAGVGAPGDDESEDDLNKWTNDDDNDDSASTDEHEEGGGVHRDEDDLFDGEEDF